MAALTHLPVEEIVAQRADDTALARIANASLVVFADPGDAWGLLGGTALAGGALVVAPTGSPFSKCCRAIRVSSPPIPWE